MVTGKVYKTHHKTLVTEMNFQIWLTCILLQQINRTKRKIQVCIKGDQILNSPQPSIQGVGYM